MSVKITKDERVWNQLKAKLISANAKEVQVGFFEGDVEDDGINVAQVAQWQNEGTVHIPRRPFFKRALDNIEDGLITSSVNNSMESLLFGSSVDSTLAKIGSEVKELIELQIEAETLPNRPQTLAKKEGSTPLVDSGLMANSVKYKIGRKGV